MQPLHDPEVRAFAWRINCNASLVVTFAVIDRYVVMLSDDNERVNQPWRLGIYKDATEAHRKAVEMTNSYERLRSGEVGEYAELTVPGIAWEHTVQKSEVDRVVASLVLEALSPKVVPH